MFSNIISLLKKNREIILYGIFGVITVIISFSVFYLCNIFFGSEHYLINNAVAWFCAVTFACFTNKFIVFRSGGLEPRILVKEIALFYFSRIMTLTIEEAGLWLLIDILNADRISFSIAGFGITGHLISKAAVGVISIIINYLFSKFVIFVKKDKNSVA